eukprot:CAMPEP_0173148854 /NCGR_PEP_ID=MMETSP1105-20130129/9975_1 /TAXON_ID=2985 /ORGANISM="Ochromonas sp., Strain BG-1" /LENGTH=228 /DNA_ID=CAMNT_0014063603 /DNA_START=165 /DNA_END=851 /DNA_ORIENTATION=-
MSKAFNGNVFFLGVARMQGYGIVVASYSYNTETDLGGVKQVLEQPNMNMTPGKHYSFAVAQLAWHLIADESGLIYILICQVSYPQRVAHACLEELQRNFAAKFGEKALTAKDRALDKSAANLLLSTCQKYDNLAEVDKLAAVQKKVESVKLVMQENVDIALQNCVKLETIEKAAEELQQQAGVFKRNANELKKKMWWKNIKMKLIIGFIILAILGIIIGVAVAMSKSK